MVSSRKIKFSLIGVVCACTSFIIFSECSKETSLAENVNSSATDEFESSNVRKPRALVFHKSVGGPINKETGKVWIENFKKRNGKAFTCTIHSSDLDEIINNYSCEGITLFNAIDSDGNRHVIPIGSTAIGKLIKTDFVTTQSGRVSWKDAIKMINNYPGETRSHFFGANTVKRLIRDEGAELVLITAALDIDNKAQLLLSDAKHLDAAAYLDMSSPCPPHCNTNEEIINK